VVTNLLLNACDAMAETGGELTLGLAARDGRALLTVADTGPGIPPDRLHKIFEPFFTTKLGRGGTGLGLSISYEIVHRHGGTIRAESEPGRGARFTVELPLHRRG
jgi:signal transduction histidine kinase